MPNLSPRLSRAAPPSVQPILYKGIQYAQDLENKQNGGAGGCGWLVAIDPKTGKRLWTLRVYTPPETAADAPTDGAYDWFAKMEINGEDMLRITAESGAVFMVNLNSQEIIVVDGYKDDSIKPAADDAPPWF